MVVIYHRKDLDGFTSGAICKLKYPDAKMIGYHYGDEFDWSQISPGEKAIMIDVSMEMEDMMKLALLAGHLTWIDHHKSAIDDFNVFFKIREPNIDGSGIANSEIGIADDHNAGKIECFNKVGIAACEIGWLVLFGTPVPESVLLLGEYDTWRRSDAERWEKHILPFQMGMRLICSDPSEFPDILLKGSPWEYGFTEFIERIKRDGETVISYQSRISKLAMHNSFETTILGIPAICCNIVGANSEMFRSVYDHEKHKVMVPFVFTGSKWVVSFFSDHEDIDCSAIAKQFGGGGHKGAAGCQPKYITDVIADYGPLWGDNSL